MVEMNVAVRRAIGLVCQQLCVLVESAFEWPRIGGSRACVCKCGVSLWRGAKLRLDVVVPCGLNLAFMPPSLLLREGLGIFGFGADIPRGTLP